MFLHSSPGTHSWFLCLCIFFLVFTLARKSSLSHDVLGPSLSKLIHVGIESSCALRKMSLKSWQLFSFIVPESCFPRDLIHCCLNRKIAFLNYSILALLFMWSMSLKTLNSTRISWLQPSLPPILTSLISYSVLVSNRPSNTSLSVRIINYSWLPLRLSWTAYSLLCHFFSRCNAPDVHFFPLCVNNSN